MPFYIEVDDNNIVKHVAETSGSVPEGAKIFETDKYKPELIGKKKQGAVFMDAAKEIVPTLEERLTAIETKLDTLIGK